MVLSLNAAQRVNIAASQQAYRLRRVLMPQWSELRTIGWTGSYGGWPSVEMLAYRHQQSEEIAASVCAVFGHYLRRIGRGERQCSVCQLINYG